MTSSRSFSSAIARSTYGLMFSAASVTLSFAFISQRSFPGFLPAKPLLVGALILAGCGGGGNSNWQQVRGHGFGYSAPAAWTVSGAAATSGPVDRVAVLIFRLVRPFDPAQRPLAVLELEPAPSRIAPQLAAGVTSTRSAEAAGRDGRPYTFAFA